MSRAAHRALLFNAVSGMLPFAVEFVIAFVMSPLFVHVLGNRNYGIWELLMGLVGYLGLLDLGLQPALIRYVADAHARQDSDLLNRVFNTGLLSMAIAGTIALIALGLLSLAPGLIFKLPAQELHAITPLLLIFGANLAVNFPRTAIGAYLLGLQQHRFVNTFRAFARIIEAVLGYHILTTPWEPPLLWLCLLTLTSSIVQTLVYAGWLWMGDTGARFSLRSFRPAMCRELVAFGFKSSVLSASISLLARLISFVIAHAIGVATIVFFAIPSRLIEYSQSPWYIIGPPLSPFFSAVAASNDNHQIRWAYERASRFAQVVTLGSPLAVMWLGEPFIRRWMGPDYATLGAVPLLILSVGLLFQSLTPNAFRLLISLGRHGPAAVFASVLAVGCFILSFPLTHAAGLAGAASAVALFNVARAVYEGWLAAKAVDLGWADFFLGTIGRFAAPYLLSSLVFGILQTLEYPATYASLLLHGAIGGAVYLAAAALTSLSRDDRRFLIGLLSTKRGEVIVGS